VSNLWTGVTEAIIGAWYTYWTYLNGKQIDMYHLYIGKYNAIIDRDLLRSWIRALNNEEIPDDIREQLEIRMVEYINLACEEYYLMIQNPISKKIWNIWKSQIVGTIRNQFAQMVIAEFGVKLPQELVIELDGM
jgi:hypothetical protein